MEWLVNQEKPLVVCVSETHVTDDFTQNEINMNGYNTINNLSSSTHTGGTAIYIKKGYAYKKISDYAFNNNMWISGIEIRIEKHKYYVYCLYHSPSSSDAEFLEKLEECLECLEPDATFIMLGDFNIDLASKSFYARKLDNLINSYGIYQLVDTYTRITPTSSTVIDLLITNNKELKQEVHHTPKITDHSMIHVFLPHIHKKSDTVLTYRNYKQMNSTDFQLKMMDIDWPSNCADANILADCLIGHMMATLNELIPEQTVDISESWGNKFWWNPEIEKEMIKRDHLYKRAIWTKTEEDWNNYTSQRNKVVSSIRSAKVNYYNSKIDEVKNNPKEMWKSLKKLISHGECVNSRREMVFDGVVVKEKDICESFNNFFLDSIKDISESIIRNKPNEESIQHISCEHKMAKFCRVELAKLRKIISLMENKESNTDGITVRILKMSFEVIGDKILDMINQSLESGIFPKKWKLTTVIPIEKISGTNKCEEFRPINMVPPYEKLLELCVNEQLVDYIETNNILSVYQAGFRRQHSCESALQTVIFNWKNALNNKKLIGVVFLDFKRAFETIDRELLLLKLQKYGMGKSILDWFGDYLRDRQQVIKYSGRFSSAKETVYGVPQGTVLGPTLFILYINDIVNVVRDCGIQLFADDTIIYCIGDNATKIIETLNIELENLFQWLSDNGLQLNTQKTKSMIIKNKYSNVKIENNVVINNEMIEYVNKFKYLGCIIDENLTFSEHYNYITKKIGKKVNLLGRLSRSLSVWAKLTVYKTIIAPHLYFCSTLLFLMNNSEIESLQKKQNKALRIILGCSRYTSRTDMINCANVLSVRQTITYNTMIFIYKMLNHLVPSHLIENCKFVIDIHQHNTRLRNNFYIDRVDTSSGQNSLYYKGLNQYNKLPDHIKNCENLNSFKKECKQYIKFLIII